MFNSNLFDLNSFFHSRIFSIDNENYKFLLPFIFTNFPDNPSKCPFEKRV